MSLHKFSCFRNNDTQPKKRKKKYHEFLVLHDASRVATSDGNFEDISEETKKVAETCKIKEQWKIETYDIP